MSDEIFVSGLETEEGVDKLVKIKNYENGKTIVCYGGKQNNDETSCSIT